MVYRLKYEAIAESRSDKARTVGFLNDSKNEPRTTLIRKGIWKINVFKAAKI